VATTPFGRELAYRLLLLSISSIVALGGAEVFFRWYTERTFDAELPPWSENLEVVRGPQVFKFRPHASGVFPGNVDQTRLFPYRTNALGLRDRERAAKAADSTRALVIGDSYTWGYAVAEDEAFPQVAERLLRARGHTDVEVVNGGVPDYNSRQERQLLEQLLPVYRPDIVFLAYVVNDAEPATAMPNPPEEAYRHSRSWFLTEVAERLNRRLFRRRILPSAKVNTASSYLEGFEADSVKWRDSREAIRQMRDLSTGAGARFSVLMLPDFTQDFDERYAFGVIHDAVVTWGRELDIPTYDLMQDFRGEDHQQLWVPWDGHPNAEAHRRIAEILVAKILDGLDRPAVATPQ
jgi:lysophospholipase L1-like esterase